MSETIRARHAGCSKRPFSKAAASEYRKAYSLGYVEDLNDVRTPHGKGRVSARRGRAGEKSDFFSILLVASFTRAEARPAAGGRESYRCSQNQRSASTSSLRGGRCPVPVAVCSREDRTHTATRPMTRHSRGSVRSTQRRRPAGHTQ